MTFYTTGHGENMETGFAYDFGDGPDYLNDMPAQRATLKQFQTYPRNLVQGAGTLVMGAPGWMPGSFFHETQPQQVVQCYEPIAADLFGGGVDYNGLVFQPLIEGS